MDVVQVAVETVTKAVDVMSRKMSALIKAKMDEKADISEVPVKVSDLTNDSNFQNAQQVEDKIDAKISSAYKAGGSATMATLPALTAAKLGVVVNMSEDFTTTADFLEGAGKTYPAGTNVVVAAAGENTYKYDVLSGFVNLSGYVEDRRKIGNVPLSADIPVTLTGDAAITVTNTGTASAIGYNVAHNDSGVTAGSKGDTTAQTPAFGGTFKALSATVDAKGHVTALGEHSVTVPSAVATSSANGLMSKGDKAKLDAIGVTASSPLEVTKSGETYNVTLKDSGVTAGSKGDTTAQTPAFGGTFKALSATVDAKGRVTALSEHNVAVPNAEATTSAAGLMSAADKAKLDKYASKGSATKGVYIDANGAPQPMTYSLNADVPANFAPATAAPLMDGTAAVGTSDKYARENHVHPTDTSRASAADVAALQSLISRMEIHCTASGNPATFDDAKAANFRNVAVTITPTQSGSGDPYPPGGGKNMLDFYAYSAALTPANASVTNNGVTFNAVNNPDGSLAYVEADGTSTGRSQIRLAGIPPSVHHGFAGMILSGAPKNSSGYIWLESAVSPWTNYAYDSGNGATIRANLTDLTDNVNILLIAAIESGTAVSGMRFYPMIRDPGTDAAYSPYSNIRPISGASSVSVRRTRKNLLEIPDFSINRNGVTAVCSDGVIKLSGTATALTQFGQAGYGIFPPGRYILSGCPAGGSSTTYDLRLQDFDGSPHIDHGSGHTFDWPGMNADISIYPTIRAGTNTNGLIFRPMIRRASDTDPTFEPYQGQAVSVTLVDSNNNPLTVYGGTLDMTTGVLTVDRANIASYNGETLPGRWISDRDVYASGATPTTGAQVVYELATPLTYTLTPAQLSTLSGYNAVSSDAASVSVTYKADPVLSLGGGT